MFFEILILLLKHFGVPLLFLWWFWKRNYKSFLDWALMALLVGAYIAFLYFTGSWYWFGYYFRYVFPVLYLITLSSVRRVRGKPFRVPFVDREKFGFFFTAFFTIIFTGLTIWAFRGTFLPAEGVPLQFPLKHGTFYVMHGGASPLLNQHYRPFPTPIQYSVDITRLLPGGTRANGLYPEDLDEYAIYGDSVFSPCNGKVVELVDSLVDMPPSEMDTSLAHVAGNHLIIQRFPPEDSIFVLLGHLMKGSFSITKGDTVVVGQYLARVGNSGFTSEPHLHIHVAKGSRKILEKGEGIPILFREHFPIRNDKFAIP
ncbi:MAG: M23 family metallopeptidase [Calditrichaeota bacterium]|nr:MAG: M23 family metallopeptidase [Calditrichota bacterium]